MSRNITPRYLRLAVASLLFAARPLPSQVTAKPLPAQAAAKLLPSQITAKPVSSQAQDDAPLFTAVNLGDIHARGLNNKGQVVGVDRGGACLWSSGKSVHLPMPPHSLNGGANAINDAGDIIGTADAPNASALNSNHALLWHNGKLRDLTKEGGFSWGLGVAINNRGEAVGKAGNYDVFVFADNKARVLPRLKEASGEQVCCLNDRGDILVTTGLYKNNDVYVWSSDRYALLATLGNPVAVNNRGDIVGYTFHWSTQAGVTVLESTTPYLYSNGVVHNFDAIAGGEYQYFIGINDAGQVAGNMGITPATPSGVFLWQNGKMYDLGKLIKNYPGGYLSFRAINNRGQILVEGSQTHPLLLTPVVHKP